MPMTSALDYQNVSTVKYFVCDSSTTGLEQLANMLMKSILPCFYRVSHNYMPMQWEALQEHGAFEKDSRKAGIVVNTLATYISLER